MPSLNSEPTNSIPHLEAEIERLETERSRLNEQLTVHDQMTHYFEDVSSYGLFKNMRTLSARLFKLDDTLMNEVSRLKQADPNHPLVKRYQKKDKKVA